MKIDYDNFPKLVDLVGGVDIFVGKPMKYVDKKLIFILIYNRVNSI